MEVEMKKKHKKPRAVVLPALSKVTVKEDKIVVEIPVKPTFWQKVWANIKGGEAPAG
jgi:hypothetical protein